MGDPVQGVFIYLQPGTHQDAEEFATLILNGMHEEILAALKTCQRSEETIVNGHEIENDANETAGDDDGWEQVGPKNKSMVTRKVVSSSITARLSYSSKIH